MPLESENWPIRCVCGTTHYIEDSDETWLQCGNCERHQHSLCMGIDIVDGKFPAIYYCEQCAPESHKELLEAFDQGIKLWEERRKLHTQKEIGEDTPKRQKKKAKRTVEDRQNSIHDHSMNEAEDKLTQGSSTTSFPLTNECHHYTAVNEVPWDIQK